MPRPRRASCDRAAGPIPSSVRSSTGSNAYNDSVTGLAYYSAEESGASSGGGGGDERGGEGEGSEFADAFSSDEAEEAPPPGTSSRAAYLAAVRAATATATARGGGGGAVGDSWTRGRHASSEARANEAAPASAAENSSDDSGGSGAGGSSYGDADRGGGGIVPRAARQFHDSLDGMSLSSVRLSLSADDSSRFVGIGRRASGGGGAAGGGGGGGGNRGGRRASLSSQDSTDSVQQRLSRQADALSAMQAEVERRKAEQRRKAEDFAGVPTPSSHESGDGDRDDEEKRGGKAVLEKVRNFFRPRSRKKRRGNDNGNSGGDAGDGGSNRSRSRGRASKTPSEMFGKSKSGVAAPGKTAGAILDSEEPVAAAVKAHSRGIPLFLCLALASCVVLLLLLVPAFYAPPADAGLPAWHPVITAGMALIEGAAAALLLSGAGYLAAKRGSVLALYLSRHAGFYFLLVATSYLIVDAARIRRTGGGGAATGAADADAAERVVRMALSALLGTCAFAVLCATEGGPCARAVRASRRAGRWTDRRGEARRDAADVHSGVSSKGRRSPRDEARRRNLYRALLRTAVVGYQLVAVAFTARTVGDYLIRDLDAAIAGAAPVGGRMLLSQKGLRAFHRTEPPQEAVQSQRLLQTQPLLQQQAEQMQPLPEWGAGQAAWSKPMQLDQKAVQLRQLPQTQPLQQQQLKQVQPLPEWGAGQAAWSDPMQLNYSPAPRRKLSAEVFDMAAFHEPSEEDMRAVERMLESEERFDMSVEMAGAANQDGGRAFNPLEAPQRSLQQPAGSSPSDAALPLLAFELELQGSALLLSLLESLGSFLCSAFILAIYSAAYLSPQDGGAVAAAALTASMKLLLGIGYAVNLSLRAGRPAVDNVDGVWSATLALLEVFLSALVLIAAFFFADSWGGLLRHRDEESTERASVVAQWKCRTLRWIATAPRHLFVKSKRRNAAALYLASNAALLFCTVQALILLSYNTAMYDTRSVVDVVKFGMQLCLLYAFVNYMSVSDRGAYYSKARRGIVGLSVGGVGLSAWQISALASGCASRGGVSPADGAVTAMLSLSLFSFFFMCVSSAALKDVKFDDVPGVDYTLNLDAKRADGQLLLEEEIGAGNRSRRRIRALLYFLYLPAIAAYGLCAAVHEGQDDGAAAGRSSYPLINVNLAPTSVGGAGAPPQTPFLFLMNCPGLPLLFHYGLIFACFAGDAVRIRPALSFSLLTARLVSVHCCVVLTAFLATMLDRFLESVASSDGGAYRWSSRAVGEKAELVLTLLWFAASVPLAASLHELWSGRRRAARVADSIGIKKEIEMGERTTTPSGGGGGLVGNV